MNFEEWYANNSHLFDRVSGQAYFNAVNPASAETVGNIFGNDLGAFLGAGGVPFTPNSTNGSGLGIDYSGGTGAIPGGGGAYDAGGGQVGYNGNDYSAFSGGPSFLETDDTDFWVNAYGTETAQPFSNEDLNTINAEDIKDKGGEPYVGTLGDPATQATVQPGWTTPGMPTPNFDPNSPWTTPGWGQPGNTTTTPSPNWTFDPAWIGIGSDAVSGGGGNSPAPMSSSGPVKTAQTTNTEPHRPDETGGGPGTGGNMPEQQHVIQNPGGGYSIFLPDGRTILLDSDGRTVLEPGNDGTDIGSGTNGTGTQTQTGGGSTDDPTGGLPGFLGQLLGSFFGGGGGAGATAQQTQGQTQTATGGDATATGGNSTNTIDMTDLVTVGPSTNTVGDLTTGASTATVGNVAGGNANVNTAGTVGNVSGGQGGLGGAGGKGGTANVNTAGTVGNVAGGSVASGAVQNDLGGLISSGAFSDLVGDISGGSLDTSGMFQSGAVQGGTSNVNTAGTVGDVNASVNTDGLGNAISSIFQGGGLLDNLIGGGANYAAGEAYKDANKDTLDFIENNAIKNQQPFVDMGTRNIPGLEAEIGNPVQNDVMAGQRTLTGPTAVKTEVNQINPFDAEDPALKYLIDQGTRAVENSRAATGKANSGGTLEALQELGQGAALNRSGELARIGGMRDNASLARDNQYYGQQLGNFQAGLQGNDQLFGQLFSQNNQNLGFDQNAYNQLSGIVGMGQNAAGNQGTNANAQAGNYNSLLQQNNGTRVAQGFGLADLLKGFF